MQGCGEKETLTHCQWECTSVQSPTNTKNRSSVSYKTSSPTLMFIATEFKIDVLK